LLLLEAIGSREIAVAHQVLHKALVGRPRGELAATSYAQCLIKRLFEAEVGLLHIAILMGDARIIPGRLHAVVPHEGLVTLGEGFLLIAGQMANCCAQMVGAMLGRNASQLPERLFDAFCQCLKGFAEAHTYRFHIGVRQHEMIQQMGKGLSVDRHLQIAHVGEIRLGTFCGNMHLLKDDFPLRPLLCAPLGNVALEGAHLRRAIPTWMSLAQLGKERRSL
jgi:hypothetical protein